MVTTAGGASQVLVQNINIEYRTLSFHLENDIGHGRDIDALFDYHKHNVDHLEQLLGTSTTQGLDDSTVNERLTKDGHNVLKPIRTNLTRKCMRYLFGGFGGILWIGCIACVLAWKPLGRPPDPANLGLAVLLFTVLTLQTILNVYQHWTSTQFMRTITNILPAQCDVMRGGQLKTISVRDIVVGDYVLLRYGNKVPADIRLVACVGLQLDKSLLTGENDHIAATTQWTDDNFLESRNIALMGTLVTNGNGAGLVIATGDSTVMGKISKRTTNGNVLRSTLQREISRLVTVIASLSLVAAAFSLLIWGTWLHHAFPTFIDTSDALVNAISVLVAFVPVGLPIGIAMALNIVARKMVSRKVLVKNLMAVESLGSVNVIASDKTGTLTQNRMFVFHACAGSYYWSNAYSDTRPLSQYSAAFVQLLAASQLCNGATFDPKTKHLPVLDQRVNGDPTDSAMLRFGAHVGSQDETDALDLNGVEVTHRIPFNSKNKWMLCVVQPTSIASSSQTVSSAEISSLEESTSNQSPDRHVFGPSHQPTLLIKGAPDVLISKTKWYLNNDGSTKPFDDTLRRMVCEQQEVWSNQGQRVLMVCKRMLQSSQDLPTDPDDLQSLTAMAHSLCLVGLVSIVDPPRPEAKQVVHECHEAGIRVFMVTGDYALTAAAIARQVGIFTQPRVDTLADLDQRISRSHLGTLLMNEKVTSPKPIYTATKGHTSYSSSDSCKTEVSWYDTSTYKPDPTSDTCTAVHFDLDERLSTLQSYRDYLSDCRYSKEPCNRSHHLSPYSGALLLSGSELSTLTNSQWDKVTQYREIVFARTSPEQKLDIVTKFQASGAVVGVTGDGVNDAPALKSANVGVAMSGSSGVALEASHMILLDNNISSILAAVEHGRWVFDIMKKCIMHLLPAGCFAEFIPIMTHILLGVPSPLSAFLMVCTGLLTDLPLILKAIYEKPKANLLSRGPRNPKRDRLVNLRVLLKAYLLIGVVETVFGHIMFFYYMWSYGKLSPYDLFFAYDKWRDGYQGYTHQELSNLLHTGQCVMFISLVMRQCFSSLFFNRLYYIMFFRRLSSKVAWPRHSFASSRKSTHISKSEKLSAATSTGIPLILLVWACSVTLAVAIIYLPVVNVMFKTRPVPIVFFFLPFGYSLFCFVLDELRRWAIRRGFTFFSLGTW
ncbi:hypothetical protein IWQ62_002006 [Dispira parvispora]|uniref:P-type Cu(+) transporter n=1 Tax=Dispira parvispora TaxID=1520584 RepID=A0A9W8AR72_9FUNG|nr:hypothetical protein IWQ62_002006 [Dispira parvispora]